MIRFKASFLNTHLFHNTAKWGGKPLGFVYRDPERTDAITQMIRESDDDVWLLAEVWDENVGKSIAKNVRTQFPHAAHSPYHKGFDDFRMRLDRVLKRDVAKAWEDRQWGRIASLMLFQGMVVFVDGNIEFFTRYLAGNHFSRSLNASQKKSLISGLLQFGVTKEHLNNLVDYTVSSVALDGPCWGGGLLLLSRHPFEEEPRFTPFPPEAKAEYERIANKGVLEASLSLPQGIRLGLFLTHFQEGESPVAISARQAEMEFLGACTEKEPDKPKLILGDCNVTAEKRFPKKTGRKRATREYIRLMEKLKAVDVFRDLYPSADEIPGFTWIPGTRIEEALNGPGGEKREGVRIDYIFRKGNLKTIHAESRPLTFSSGEHASDHCLVRGEFEIPG